MTQPVFVNGPPRFDVGLRPIQLSHWLTPDDQAQWLGAKNQLIDSVPQQVYAETTASLAAQGEAAQLIAALYPQTSLTDEAPLLAASRFVSDDLVIMEESDGAWTTSACCLCSPTFFSASHALGKSLLALHAPVPDGDFGLAARIGRVFSHLQPDTVLERHNWTVQWSDARFSPDGSPLRAAAAQATLDQAHDQLFLRVERQTIRKLPDSGAVLFTIRIKLTRLVDTLVTQQNQHDFEKAWKDAPQSVRDYKKWAVLERHVAHILQR